MKSYEGKNLEKKLEKIIKACEDKIAHDVVSVKLDPQGALADYFVIATGNTPNQTQSIIDEVEDVCEKEGYEILGKEGYSDGHWILLDINDIIVHVFTPEERDYYDLERLWSDK